MKNLLAPLAAPNLQHHDGLYWCAAWFALLALMMFAGIPFADSPVSIVFLIVAGVLHGYAVAGLLRGLKPAWHIAAFLAFAMMVTRIVAISCTPGAIAAGQKHLGHATVDMVLLAISIIIFRYLRRPAVRRDYGVPESYRQR